MAEQFSRLGSELVEYERLYIVTSELERKTVKRNDSSAHVFLLLEYIHKNEIYDNLQNYCDEYKINFNNDRFLRNYSSREIKIILNSVISLINDLVGNFKIKYYVDEPVSNLPNAIFNSVLGAKGIICMHFHCLWLPGHMFFVHDKSQRAPATLNLIPLGEAKSLVSRHYEQRAKGHAKPVYVINYSSFLPRLKDITLLSSKVLLRKLLRKREFYINKDPRSHLTQIGCLLASFKGGYDDTNDISRLNKVVIYPLHYEPEAVVSYYSENTRQVDVVNSIIDALPIDYHLLLKEHPSQPGALNTSQWKCVRENRRVLKMSGSFNVNALLSDRTKEVTVVSLGSTMALESAMLGRRTVIIGGVHFSKMPGVLSISDPKDWTLVLNHKSPDLTECLTWYLNFVSVHSIKGYFSRNHSSPISADEFTRVLDMCDTTI